MIRLITYGVSLLITTSAMAQSVAEKSGVNSMAGIAPTTQDFVTEAAQSDMFEIPVQQARAQQRRRAH